jgi:transcriptional regulator CtsR
LPLLSDSIERFIKELMAQGNEVSLRRNELAQHFGCAPSQINYVLSTRFTLDSGYVIASRRGGGGYIRVMRIAGGGENLLRYMACSGIGEGISKARAHAMINRLLEEKTITLRESRLMKTAVDNCAQPVAGLQDGMRARILKSMFCVLLMESI